MTKYFLQKILRNNTYDLEIPTLEDYKYYAIITLEKTNHPISI